MNDPTLWGIVAIAALAVLGVAAWLLLHDTTPRPPGRHERSKRTPQEPIHGDDEPPPENGDLPMTDNAIGGETGDNGEES